ncbi:MAG: hypothetical protein HDQ97_04535 [Lachnospiraceae bacterium]|nr:hypothetical protein [Lachnospiraceae bacterium]
MAEYWKKCGKEIDMGNKIRISKSFFLLLAFGILLCGVCIGRADMTVKAKEQTFLIDAEMLPSDQSAYGIQLKVENQGQDWEGTVRLRMISDYGGSNDCAYDTALSLPQGSTKQFVVRVPKDSIDRTDAVVRVTLLDKNAGEVARKEFGRLLQEEADALTLGILSDEYLSLTYLDMGGSEFYYDGKTYPIRLMELNQDKLEGSLDTLNFLVIDSYNTSVLSDKALENIKQWRDNGGVLIVGTGSCAEEVLSGLDDLEIRCTKVYEPGEGTYDSSDYVDVSQLSMAELTDMSGRYEEGYGILILMCSWGDGAVGILPYSLAEAAQLNAIGGYGQQKSFVESLLQQVSSHHRSSQYDYNGTFVFTSICNFLGNGSNRLRFGGLKVIVILYVIFVGPILYLILRFAKKRDFYWIAVPVTTLVGIFLVYWAGRGVEVVNTNVYSVTIENLSGGEKAQSYLHCYDAGHKEWELRLAEGYEYVGPLEDSYYRSSDENYFYHIRKEGDRLFFGIRPSTGFEDSCFQAGIAKEPENGSIYSELQDNGRLGVSGTVTNETGRDFKYFAVVMGGEVFVYKYLPAGADIKLEAAEMVYNNDGGYYDGIWGYCFSFLPEVQSGEMAEDVDILTALGIGISFVYPRADTTRTVIVGVTEDWDKVVDDNCSEVSYGCLYAIQ